MRQITQQYQPARSRLCGQTCVAMLAGISLNTCIDKAFEGRKASTTVRHLVYAIRRLGLKCKDGLTLVQDDAIWPDAYIAQVKTPGRRNWHWVLFVRGSKYDPREGASMAGKYINAYLEVLL